MATLTEMRANIQLHVGSSASITEGLLDRCLKRAERRISHLFDFPEHEVKETVTITGDGSTDEWTLGTTAPFDSMAAIKGQRFYSVIWIKTSDTVELKYMNPRQWDKQILPRQSLIGDPYYYTLWANKIQIHKIPTNTETYNLQLRYYKLPTFPASGATAFEVTEMEMALESLATTYVFLSMEETTLAARWMSIFKTDMSDMLMDLGRFLNYEHSNKSQSQILSGEYWANPFVKGL